MISGSCHCGAVRVELARVPRTLTSCNCSICRRYSTLWAYCRPTGVKIVAAPDATESYSWGRRSKRFVRCRSCGTIVNWERVRPGRTESVAINGRLFAPEVLGPVRIRHLDGANTWKYLD